MLSKIFQQLVKLILLSLALQKKINETVGKRVIQNPMQLAIAAAQGYGDLKPNEVPQSPAFLQRAGTTSQKRQMDGRPVGS